LPHTLREIANFAGVSIATASRVVNGQVSVSAATRAKVSEAISRFGYSPNVHAALLAKTKCGASKGRYRSGLELNFPGRGIARAQSCSDIRLKDDLFARVQELENENLRLRRLLVKINQDTNHPNH
jgi:transcriptional regulator with XRE-family HTH domain